jgi:hypothetical protein
VLPAPARPRSRPVFRGFALEHPSLFRIGVQRALPEPQLWDGFRAAAGHTRAGLEARIERLKAAQLLGDRGVRDVAREFHSLCEGLAAMELPSALPPGDEEWIWHDALTALVRGFAATPASACCHRAEPVEHPSVATRP